MVEAIGHRVTQDKPHIFVSSRLGECKAERQVVSDAIRQLNYRPVLFEHLGARPYGARDLYLSRLRESQIMVAIYRDGYGYINVAGGMTMSGLEDEYRFARHNRITSLFYVHENAAARDVQLAAIIAEVVQHSVPFSYSKPEELGDRVRDDITAAITEMLLRKSSPIGVLEDTAGDLLGRTKAWSGGSLVRRTAMLANIETALSTSRFVCLYGGPGAGKTTLAAQFAEATGATFVRVTGLAPKEVFGVCANALMLGAEPVDYGSLMEAFDAFKRAWSDAPSISLVIDECDNVEQLLLAVRELPEGPARRQLLFTSREPLPPVSNVLVSALTAEERPSEDQSSDALRLQQAVVQRDTDTLLAAVHAIPTTTRELVTFLALSPDVLSGATLIALHGESGYTIERLSEDIALAKHLVDDGPRGFRLVHNELSVAIQLELQESPQKLQFYVRRLANQFEVEENFKLAYAVARLAADGSEQTYALPALRQATIDGDWRQAVKIADALLLFALDRELQAEAFRLNLQLTHPLELMGDKVRASEVLESAKRMVPRLGAWAERQVREIEVGESARRTMDAESVGALEVLHASYADDGWNQARIGVELSSIYMALRQFGKSIAILRLSLRQFEELGDDYGVEIARFNLASSLIGEDSASLEAESMLVAIDATSAAGSSDARRQRAWRCNILARQYREADRFGDAQRVAREAVALGESLGDEYLRAINLINLGNSLADDDKLQEAIEAYQASGIAAQRCGRHDVEADASRLAADKLNDHAKDAGSQRLATASRAKAFAEHAVGLLTNSLNHYSRGYAFVELGRAQRELGDDQGASRSYFAAAKEGLLRGNEGFTERTLLTASELSVSEYPDAYVVGLRNALGISDTSPARDTADEYLSLVAPIVKLAPRDALTRLLSTHLNVLRSHLAPSQHDALASAVVEAVREVGFAGQRSNQWRVLYASVVIAALLKDSDNEFLFNRLAQSIASSVRDVFAREETDRMQFWTVVLDLGQRVTVTISALDTTRASRVACLALASFIKAFEPEFANELSIHKPAISELAVYVARLDKMPGDLQKAMETFGVNDALKDGNCVVTRPARFDDKPDMTAVVLSSEFAESIKLGEEEGGALQELFGLTLVELVFQLLRGEVDLETIRPKVVSLVRRTM